MVAGFFALLALPIAAHAQDSRETLTLDQAIQLALEHKRLIKHEVLEVAKAAERVEIARTRRRPEFESKALALQPFTSLDFRFHRGVLGNIPSVGLFPLQDVRVGSGHQPFALLTARVSQPLTQPPHINFGLRWRWRPALLVFRRTRTAAIELRAGCDSSE